MTISKVTVSTVKHIIILPQIDTQNNTAPAVLILKLFNSPHGRVERHLPTITMCHTEASNYSVRNCIWQIAAILWVGSDKT